MHHLENPHNSYSTARHVLKTLPDKDPIGKTHHPSNSQNQPHIVQESTSNTENQIKNIAKAKISEIKSSRLTQTDTIQSSATDAQEIPTMSNTITSSTNPQVKHYLQTQQETTKKKSHSTQGNEPAMQLQMDRNDPKEEHQMTIQEIPKKRNENIHKQVTTEGNQLESEQVKQIEIQEHQTIIQQVKGNLDNVSEHQRDFLHLVRPKKPPDHSTSNPHH